MSAVAASLTMTPSTRLVSVPMSLAVMNTSLPRRKERPVTRIFAPTSLPILMALSASTMPVMLNSCSWSVCSKRLPLDEFESRLAGEQGRQGGGHFAAGVGVGRIVDCEVEDGDRQPGRGLVGLRRIGCPGGNCSGQRHDRPYRGKQKTFHTNTPREKRWKALAGPAPAGPGAGGDWAAASARPATPGNPAHRPETIDSADRSATGPAASGRARSAPCRGSW